MKNSETLSEIIGIILGDGSFRYDEKNYKYNVTIFLNGIDDYAYYRYVKNLLSNFFHTHILEYWYKDSKKAQGNEKGVSLTIFDKEIIQSLLEKGLIPGDKIKNNISVPFWIKAKKSFILRCLKGLIDTDGYIGAVKTKNPLFSKIVITFNSRSDNLVADFKEMTEKINIKCSNINGPYETIDSRTKKKYLLYSISIQAKDQVQKFLQEVAPKKWEYRRELIGKILNLYQNPIKYNKVKKIIREKYGKMNFFTKEQQKCLDGILSVSTKDIENSINEAFSYNKIHYSIGLAEEFKQNLIRLGSLREVERFYNRKNEDNLKVYRKTIVQYLEKLFTEESKYKNLYGGIKGFNIWKKYNFDFLIKDQGDKVSIYRYPFFIKKKICWIIHQIMRKTNDLKKVYSKLKNIIENIDLNGNIIDRKSFYVLKFERISILLNAPNIKAIIQSELKLLIKVVNEFRNIAMKDIKMKIEELSTLLRKKFNLNWKPENLKDLLNELHLYNYIINKEDINQMNEELAINNYNGSINLKENKKIPKNIKTEMDSIE